MGLALSGDLFIAAGFDDSGGVITDCGTFTLRRESPWAGGWLSTHRVANGRCVDVVSTGRAMLAIPVAQAAETIWVAGALDREAAVRDP